MNASVDEQNKYVYAFDCTLIFVVAVLIRLLAFRIDPAVSRDGVRYLQMAKELAALGPVGFYRDDPLNWIPPLYLHLVAWGIRAGFDAGTFAVGINVLFGSLTAVAAYWIGEAITKERLGAIAGGCIVIFAPLMVKLSYECQRESIFLFCSALCLYFTCLLCKGKFCGAYGAVAAAVTACFFRFEGLALVAGSFLVMTGCIIVAWRQKKFRTIELGHLAACVIVAILLFEIARRCMQLPETFFSRQFFRLTCRWHDICRMLSW